MELRGDILDDFEQSQMKYGEDNNNRRESVLKKASTLIINSSQQKKASLDFEDYNDLLDDENFIGIDQMSPTPIKKKSNILNQEAMKRASTFLPVKKEEEQSLLPRHDKEMIPRSNSEIQVVEIYLEKEREEEEKKQAHQLLSLHPTQES